jgi:cell division protein FtsX
MTTSRRWAFPCAGSVLVEGSGDDVVRVTAEEELAAPQLIESEKSKVRNVEPIDWSSTLRTLSDKAKKLKKRVRDLKKLYVSIIILILIIIISNATRSSV